MLCSKMNWKITYYSFSVQQDIMSLPKTLRARYVRMTDRMLNFGAHLGEPHTKSMGDGLLELRLKGQEGIARVLYCTVIEKEIVMLHSFIKKQNKTPLKDLKIARLRLTEIKSEK
jgi:phage-related protein